MTKNRKEKEEVKNPWYPPIRHSFNHDWMQCFWRSFIPLLSVGYENRLGRARLCLTMSGLFKNCMVFFFCHENCMVLAWSISCHRLFSKSDLFESLTWLINLFKNLIPINMVVFLLKALWKRKKTHFLNP